MPVPAPLPPINEIPEVITAHQQRQDYAQQVTAIRARTGDAITKARTVVDLWQRTNTALASGRQDVLARRGNRVAWLESQVPGAHTCPCPRPRPTRPSFCRRSGRCS